MKKVKLLLKDLQVESFEVSPSSLGGGTVQGLEDEFQAESGVHTNCYTHCPTNCEPCNSQSPTHCNGDTACASWDGGCATNAEFTCWEWDYTCGWDCGGGTTIEA